MTEMKAEMLRRTARDVALRLKIEVDELYQCAGALESQVGELYRHAVALEAHAKRLEDEAGEET